MVALDEARRIIRAEVQRLRDLPYGELTRYLEPHAFEVQAPSGRNFQLEVYAVWDDRKQRNLRVLVHIDDGTGMRSTPFLIEDFIIAPNGTFVGEP